MIFTKNYYGKKEKNMEIKIANLNDANDILKIINQAKIYMKENNLNQWNEKKKKR